LGTLKKNLRLDLKKPQKTSLKALIIQPVILITFLPETVPIPNPISKIYSEAPIPNLIILAEVPKMSLDSESVLISVPKISIDSEISVPQITVIDTELFHSI
jgi:hypothetical protein